MKTQVTSKNVNILERKEIKRNGVILYTLLSSDGVTKYFATVENGKITAHDCLGYINCGHCYHSDYIYQAEAIAQYDIQNVANQIVNHAEAVQQMAVRQAEFDAKQRREEEQMADEYPQFDTCVDCGKLIGKGMVSCYSCGC